MPKRLRNGKHGPEDGGRRAREDTGPRKEYEGDAGYRLASAAEPVRERAPQEGAAGAVAARVAGTLEQGARFLRQEGWGGLAGGVKEFVVRNPLPAVLLGVGVGYVLGRLA